MGEKDLAEKTLESYNDVFADIVNGLVFNGEQVVGEDELEDATPMSYYKASGKVREQTRDIAKRWMMGDVCIALVGLENQTEPDPYMPIRVLSYDAAEYRAQILKYRRKAIRPAITLVIYLGYKRRWNGPRTLRGLLGLRIPPAMDPLVHDYAINLYEIAWMSPAEVNKRFHGDFRILANHLVQKRIQQNYIPDLQTMRHAREVLQLLSLTEHDHRYEEVYNELVQETPNGEEGAWNMCDVLDKAINSGIERGRIEGREEGYRSARRDSARGMYREGILLEQIARVLETDVQTVQEWLHQS